MKFRTIIFIIASFLLSAFPVSADELRDNPSLYSFAEIAEKLPKMWMANPIEVEEMMRSYPDFTCRRKQDSISCQSVNNRNCAEIYLTLDFTSDDNYAEFEHVSFSMQIDETEDIQKAVEAFWIEDLEASNISGARYSEDQVTLYFSTENTLVCYGIPFSDTGVWLLRVDFGFVRG